MPRITVRPFETRDIDSAAALLAARHRRDRKRLPVLSVDLESPNAAGEVLAALRESPRASGAVAVSDGSIAGFAIGERATEPPADSYMGQLAVPQSVSLSAVGHAVAERDDAIDIYRLLYRELAEEWVAAGHFHHSVHLVAGDEVVQEAWLTLGFGRHVTCAVREGTTPVEGPKNDAIEIRRATKEDVAEVVGLARSLGLHHISSPMFMYWPVFPEHALLARGYLGKLLEGDNPHFVAYENGKPVGMTTFLRQGFIPPYVSSDANVYLFMGIVESDARDGGVGRALLDHGMAWARGEGYERSTLHVLSANYSGAPFWFGMGFAPVEHSMDRHIDERVYRAQGGL
jgi:GNAT superfamily N-acetyltransferase